MKKKKIVVIYTGGTIGSLPNDSGLLRPERSQIMEDSIRDYLSGIESLGVKIGEIGVLPEFEFTAIERPFDSSDLDPKHWDVLGAKLFNEIQKSDIDGAVVLHGTDTLAYTASALAFMIEGLHLLNKTVVVTGAQLSFFETRSDAKNQLISAILLASNSRLREVVVYFDNRVLRACRTTKSDSFSFNAFDSPNFPELAHFGVTLSEHPTARFSSRAWNVDLTRRFTNGTRIQFYNFRNRIYRIGVLKIFPGISENTINSFFSEYDALVIEGYGAGNGPIGHEGFLRALNNGIHIRKKPAVIVTQCVRGSVSFDYSTSLEGVGLINGRDMTTEAAVTKLHYLLSKYGPEMEKVRSRFDHDLIGEVTIPNHLVEEIELN
ncbi:MAG: asparaginase [Flavobacteriales bacterium]|nr:asparaginase [Flavobacteriales bacterium]